MPDCIDSRGTEGLAECQRLFREKAGKDRFTNAIAQHRQLNALKQTDFAWMYDYSKCIPQEALRDLDRSYENYHREKKKRKTCQTPGKKSWALARFHQQLVNRWLDHHHKLSVWLTKNHGVLVTEDLYVAGLIKNRRQAKG